MLISEDFKLRNINMPKKDGTTTPIVIIDPDKSDSVFQYKDTLKNEFGAVFFSKLKAWGWFVSDRSVYNDKIKPCLEWLKQQIGDKDEDEIKTEVMSIIDELINTIGSATNDINDNTLSKKEVEERLKSYKADLVSAMSDAQFKALLEPIIKFRNAHGHQMSFGNAILIWIQDPEATLVKSRSNWKSFNRLVKEDAPALWAYIPVPNGKPKRLSAEERENIISSYLIQVGVESKEDLTPGQLEELKIQLRNYGTDVTFVMKPRFYDVRHTEQMPGKPDMVGSNNTDNIEWYTEGGEATDKTTQLINAMAEIIKESGVSLSYVKNLGGARGVSKSGSIDVLQDAKKNEGLLNTMVHEFAHEILHQKYLHSNNPEYSNYFVGTAEGRSKVEQQAELTAWIVLRDFGFDMKTNINYVGIWGMNEKNAAKVFDSVASTAVKISDKIKSKLKNTTNEGRMYINEGFLTGEELADMVGCGDVYRRSKKMEQMDESRRMFTEGFKSLVSRMATVENNTKKRDLL